jgi:hypothetical protein
MTDMSGWSRAEMHVLAELERLSHEVRGLRAEMTSMKAGLAVTSTAYRQHGLIFGLIGGTVASLLGGIVLAVVLR